MLKLIQEIKDYTEAGAILEHMELFDILEANAKVLLKHDDDEHKFNVVADDCVFNGLSLCDVHDLEMKFMSGEIKNIEIMEGDYYELK